MAPSRAVRTEAPPEGKRLAVKFADFLIDEQTGEVLEWPDGFRGDLLDELIRRAANAKLNAKAWDDVHSRYRHAIGRILTERDLHRYAAPSGLAAWRRRITKSATIDTLTAAGEKHKLGPDILADIILLAAKTLDVEQVESLAGENQSIFPPGTGARVASAVPDMIEEKVTRWVQIDQPREEPPRVEHVLVDDAEAAS